MALFGKIVDPSRGESLLEEMRPWGQALDFLAKQHFLFLPLPSLAWLLQGSLSLWNSKSKQPLSYIGFIEVLYHKRKEEKKRKETTTGSGTEKCCPCSGQPECVAYSCLFRGRAM